MKHAFLKLFYLLHNKTADYDLTVFIRTLAISLISVFIPLFLIEEGSLFLFLVYLLSTGVFYTLAVLISNWVMDQFSSLGSITLSMVFFVVGLRLAEFLTIPTVALAAFLLKTAELLFWFPLHVEFPKVMTKHRTRGFTGVIAITTLTPFIAPLLGAKVIDLFGYESLFNFAMLVYALILLPQGLLGLRKELFSIQIPKFRFRPFYFLEGWHLLVLPVMWPSFLFMSGWARDEVALLVSTISLAGGLTALLASHINLKKLLPPQKAFSLSYYAHGLSVFVRALTIDKLFSFVGGSLGYITYVIFKPLFMSTFYRRVARRRAEIIERDLNIGLGMFASSLLLTFMTYMLGVSLAFQAILLLSSVVSFVFAYKFKVSV